MIESRVSIVCATDVRRLLAPSGDLRADVAFQNDVNGLLSALAEMEPPLPPRTPAQAGRAPLAPSRRAELPPSP